MTPAETALEVTAFNRRFRVGEPVTYEGQSYVTDSEAWAEDAGAVVRIGTPAVRLKVPCKDVRLERVSRR